MNHFTISAAFLVAGGAASAQVVGGGWARDFAVTPSYSGQRFAPAVGVGDQNGDGYDDFAIASAFRFFNGPGEVLVHSGRDGSQIRVLSSPDPIVSSFDSVAAAGDVDGDGIGDVVAGASYSSIPGLGRAGTVLVYSGATGAVLLRVDGTQSDDKLGNSVAAAGDVDGDGHADLIAGGGYSQYNHGIVSVISGASGQELFNFRGALLDAVGWAVCGVGDWNADGRDDFAYSAITMDVGLVDRAGSVFVHSGADGSVLHRYDGESEFQRLGWDLDAADVDADGILDLVIGDPWVDLPGKEDVGCVRVYSGATGLLIRQIFGELRGDAYAYSVARAGNLDGDAHDDLVVGIPYADSHGRYNAGSIHLLSGRNGAILREELGASFEEEFGSIVACAGNVDADGFDHVLASSYSSPAIYLGGYQTFLTPSADSVSIAAGGHILFDLRFPEKAGGSAYQFLVSRTGTGPAPRFGLQVPLTPDALFYRTSDRDYPAAASGFSGILSADGNAGASLLIPPGSVPAAMIGREIWFAVVARDWSGAGLYSSVARSLRFEP